MRAHRITAAAPRRTKKAGGTAKKSPFLAAFALTGALAGTLAGVLAAGALMPTAAAARPAHAATVPAANVDRAALEADGLRAPLLNEALAAAEARGVDLGGTRYLTIIDYSRHSSEPRMFVLDLETGRHQALLVAHGRGSDPDHDGIADRFSNTPQSKMTSLGAFLTGETYYGKHGLSLRLVGLDASNDAAMERAIVIHGADYVSQNRNVLGRSWGCPAIERRYAEVLIPKLAGGTFVYATR